MNSEIEGPESGADADMDWKSLLQSRFAVDPPPDFCAMTIRRMSDEMARMRWRNGLIATAAVLLLSGVILWGALLHLKSLAVAGAAMLETAAALVAVLVHLWQTGPLAGVTALSGCIAALVLILGALARVAGAVSLAGGEISGSGGRTVHGKA